MACFSAFFLVEESSKLIMTSAFNYPSFARRKAENYNLCVYVHVMRAHLCEFAAR